MLPTIASRCQELRLRPVPRLELAQALVDSGVTDAPNAPELAALAAGAPGWAIQAAATPDLLRQRMLDLAELHGALGAGRLERLVRSRAIAETWWSNPDRVRGLLRAWLAWWRDVLLVQLGLGSHISHLQAEERAALATAADAVSFQAVCEAQAKARQTLEDLDANVNARLALDLLFLALPAATV